MNIGELLKDIKGVIFDLDGTIVDSMGVWQEIDKQYFLMKGYETVPEGYANKISHMSFYEIAKYTKETYHFEETIDQIIEIWDILARHAYTYTVMAKPGIRKLLVYLKQHDIKIALATSNTRKLFTPCLKHNAIYDLFDFLFSGSELGTSKSEPTIYLIASDALKTKPSETLVFEDVLIPLTTAKNAGFKTVAVYDKSSEKVDDEKRQISDFYIKSYMDIEY